MSPNFREKCETRLKNADLQENEEGAALSNRPRPQWPPSIHRPLDFVSCTHMHRESAIHGRMDKSRFFAFPSAVLSAKTPGCAFRILTRWFTSKERTTHMGAWLTLIQGRRKSHGRLPNFTWGSVIRSSTKNIAWAAISSVNCSSSALPRECDLKYELAARARRLPSM